MVLSSDDIDTDEGHKITLTLHEYALALHQQMATSTMEFKCSPVMASASCVDVVHMPVTLEALGCPSCLPIRFLKTLCKYTLSNGSSDYSDLYQPIKLEFEVATHEKTNTVQMAFVDDYLH